MTTESEAFLISLSERLCPIAFERFASLSSSEQISLFRDGPPANRSVHQDVLEEIDPELALFEELDGEFYEYPDDLTTLLYEFVVEHRSDIRGP